MAPAQIASLTTALPLRYGDAIILQHKTYGFYLQPALPVPPVGQIGWSLYGVTTKPTTNNLGYFFVEPLDANNRFGSAGVAGSAVTSGSNFRLESVYGQNIRASNESFGLFFNIDTGGNVLPVTGYPYQAAMMQGGANSFGFMVHSNGTENWPGGGCKIYKLGAHVGEPIYKGDPVYIVTFNGWYSGAAPIWLGSANVSYNGGFEIFALPTTTTPPPNFQTKYIWTISDIKSALYLDSQVVKSGCFSGTNIEIRAFPTNASSFQF